jgi:L-iditol 2-dehydrogenase
LELICDRKVSVADMVTHRLPLAETGYGFQLSASGQDSIKVIIDPML